MAFRWLNLIWSLPLPQMFLYFCSKFLYIVLCSTGSFSRTGLKRLFAICCRLIAVVIAFLTYSFFSAGCPFGPCWKSRCSHWYSGPDWTVKRLSFWISAIAVWNCGRSTFSSPARSAWNCVCVFGTWR